GLSEPTTDRPAGPLPAAEETPPTSPAASAEEAAEEPLDEVIDLVEEVNEEEEELVAAIEELGVDLDIDIDIDEPEAIAAPLPEPVPPRPIATLEEAVALMEKATGRDELGSVLLRFAMARGSRALLLTRRGRVWFGWLGAGQGVDPGSIPGLMLPSEPGTAFGLVGETGAPFLGPLAKNPVHDAFLARLGGARPGSVGLFPVHHRGKLVFGIYLDGGDGRNLSPDVGELLLLAQKAAMALQRLVLARTDR
ncbi:MAG: hypothetical protein ACOCVR_04795, partial [Myxococcota bacterium]